VGLKEIVLDIVYRIHVILNKFKQCVRVNEFLSCVKNTESREQLSNYQFSVQELFTVILLTWTMRF
jgi:hypothetical protein